MGLRRPVLRSVATALRACGPRLGLLALLVQLVATALPMPAVAGGAAIPAWLAASLCQAAPAAPGGEQPGGTGHLICPVCFVLSAAASAVPPPPVVLPAAPLLPRAAHAIPRMPGLSPLSIGSTALSRAPPAV